MDSAGLSKKWAPTLLVLRLLPGWNTLLHTLSFLLLPADLGDGVPGVVGVDGPPPASVTGIDIDLTYLVDELPSP